MAQELKSGQQRLLSRVRSAFRLTPEQWDKNKSLRGWLGFALMVSTLCAGVQWYAWAQQGIVALHVPMLWTLVSVVIFLVAPRKIDLLFYCSGTYFALALIGTVLHKADMRTALEVTTLSGIATFIFAYIEVRRSR